MTKVKTFVCLLLMCLMMVSYENRTVAQDDLNPIVLYISRAAEVTSDEIKTIVPGATVVEVPGDLSQTSAGNESRFREFELQVGDAKYSLFIRDQGIARDQLNGLSGFLQHHAEIMDQHTFHIIRRVQRTSTVLSLVPSKDWNDESRQLVRKLAAEFKAVVFSSDQTVTDHDLRTMSGPEENRDPKATMLEYDSALARRTRSFQFLQEKNLKVPTGHPVVVADEEVRFRSAKEIADRALVLAIVAAHAGEPNPEFVRDLIRSLDLAKAVSPDERAFLRKAKPDAEEAHSLTWRYEACYALLWSVGLEDELPFPTDQCDANKIVELLLDPEVKQKVAKAKLRPTSEILDAVDLTYRLAWIGQNARMNNQPEPISPDVVLERHYAFCWLIRHFNRDWDDVSPDT